jgi:membrane protease YdiL (CAAX protease family)
MKKSNLIAVIDLVAFVAFLFLTTTGVLLRYLLPERSGHWKTILGLNKHEWGTLHFWIAVVLLVVLALHLLQHKKYIRNVFKGRNKEKINVRVALGIIGLIAIILLAMLPLAIPVKSPSQIKKPDRQHFQKDKPVSLSAPSFGLLKT